MTPKSPLESNWPLGQESENFFPRFFVEDTTVFFWNFMTFRVSDHKIRTYPFIWRFWHQFWKMTKISANFRNVLRMISKDKFTNCQRPFIKSEVISRARLCCLFLSKVLQELRLKRRGLEPLVVTIVIWHWKTILKVRLIYALSFYGAKMVLYRPDYFGWVPIILDRSKL